MILLGQGTLLNKSPCKLTHHNIKEPESIQLSGSCLKLFSDYLFENCTIVKNVPVARF